MALARITKVSGRAVPIPGDDIDTDQIVPARFLISVTFDGLGKALFFDARHQKDGSSKGHPLDDARYQGASIAISGKNFGCGSSREHAPQAFHKAGFRAIIAESFAEIFFGNSTTLGIACVSLSEGDLAQLAALVERDPSVEVTVDLEQLEVRAGGSRYAAQIKPSARDALVRGEWDPIADLLEAKDAVSALKQRLPYTSW
jgi:3-isopropylmalate/(R)-2-methylmalate dehydratase small subunit